MALLCCFLTMIINIVESVQVMYEFYPNVQMFVSILSSFTVLFHKHSRLCLQDVSPLGKRMHGFTSEG